MSDTRKTIREKTGQISKIQARLPKLRDELTRLNDSVRPLKVASDDATRAALLDEGESKAAEKARAAYDSATTKQRSLVDQVDLAEKLLTKLSDEVAALRKQAEAQDMARLVELLPSKLAKLEDSARDYFAGYVLLLAAKAGALEPGFGALQQGAAFMALIGEDTQKAIAFNQKIAALRRDLVGESV